METILDLVTLTLFEIVRLQCELRGECDAALTASGFKSMSYAQLIEHVDFIARQLAAMGIRRGDRIALVLPSGPEMVTLFLATTRVGTAAPLNPIYRRAEFEFYLRDLRAKVLIVPAASTSPAVDAARHMGIPVLEVHTMASGPAGYCHFEGAPNPGTHSVEWSHAEDTALVLHTSGTTGKPKIVPLTHKNMCAATRSMRECLQLSPADRCISIMPLFHIHGLSAVLASLSSGGSVFCVPAFSGRDFWPHMQQAKATWYTAAPTVHREIIARFAGNESWLRQNPLRFVRSASSAMPIDLAHAIEQTLGVPLIEAYGMTEAAPQIASNPVNARDRRLGTVGLPAGPEIRILGKNGEFLSSGSTGEVAIRGENVMGGYWENPEANAEAFTNGWLRTGDLGFFDGDGYLHIAGRAKEIINRGGEKIAPAEVEAVLCMHPSVLNAVTFAMPDKRVGEEVGAAVVLRSGAHLQPDDLAVFASEYLSDFKVPRKIKIVDQLPISATGKVKRVGLAQELGMIESSTQAPSVADLHSTPSAIENRLERIWADILKLCSVDRDASFFDLGGDSLLAVALVTKVTQEFSLIVPPATLFSYPTIRRMSVFLDTRRQVSVRENIVTLHAGGAKRPVFVLPGVGGQVIGLRELARLVGVDRTVYGIEPRGTEANEVPLRRIEDMAAYAISAMRRVSPKGPYNLIGFSGGGRVAFEVAQQLRKSGDRVAILAMLDSAGPGFPQVLPLPMRLVMHAKEFLHGDLKERKQYLRQRLVSIKRRSFQSHEHKTVQETPEIRPVEKLIEQVELAFREAERNYEFLPYEGKITLFYSTIKPHIVGTRNDEPTMGWGTVARRGIEIITVPGSHTDIIHHPVVDIVADELRKRIDAAEESLKAN